MNAKVTDAISIDRLVVEDVELQSMKQVGCTETSHTACQLQEGHMPLNPVWRSKMYSKHAKLRMLKSCVTSVLLYDVKLWRGTSQTSSAGCCPPKIQAHFGCTSSPTLNSIKRVPSRKLRRSGDRNRSVISQQGERQQLPSCCHPQPRFQGLSSYRP